MEIYQADGAETRTVEGATAALARAAGRIVLSIIRSIPYLQPAAAEHIENLLSPSSLWVLGIILAGWVIATVVGGPIALVINGLLGAYGLYQLYAQLAITWQNLRDWGVTAYRAKNDAELDKASRYFAQAVTDGGLAFIEVIITHRIFKSVEGSLRKRYQQPAWLEAEYRKAMEARRKAPAKTAETEPNRARAKEDAESIARRRSEFEGRKVPVPPPPLPPGGDSPIPAILGGVVALVGVGTAAVLIARSRQ